MELKVGQIWRTNLPKSPKLQVVNIDLKDPYFPVRLVDRDGRSHYATIDGYLRQLISPMGHSYKLTILVAESGDLQKLSFKEQKEKEVKERKEHNQKVINDYRLRRPKYEK